MSGTASVLDHYVRLSLGLPEPGMRVDKNFSAAVRATLNLDAFVMSEAVRNQEIVRQKELEALERNRQQERTRAVESPEQSRKL